ncbi:MAG TPA: hypothetical protein P5555_02335 [Candidatus Paceibacterota bacterium]|nr:hypothetical protein [Verrucomicrobiota bacterium]HRZ44011.1 hypothetical protein [Candidatus Paceibacterota bacterium]HRZ92070.1 hypothetical protein [Candidatus Paceibacterota bacterium]
MKAACFGLVFALCASGVCRLAVEARGGDSADPAGPVRTQVIEMQAGWNAVFLEVHPLDGDPAAVFGSLPVDIVASFFERSTAAQFVVNPDADLYRRAGWGVWYAAGRPDAFLKTLHGVHGQQAYLIRARSAFTWRITGLVTAPEVQWQADAFNLVGFSVDSQAAPTFAQFFAGSMAHRHNRLYRLTGGIWRRVLDPDAEAMRSGEAFWIYCVGASRYQGPLEVKTTIRRGVVLGSVADTVILRNRCDHPVTPTVAHVVAGLNPVPLSLVVQAYGDNFGQWRSVAVPQTEASWTQALPPLEAGQAIQVPLEAERQAMQAAVHRSLLRITTDLGTEVWVPVFAIREDLEEK